jgi:hypothetical protein
MFKARFDSPRIPSAHQYRSKRGPSLLFFVLALSGCGKQAEGERCDLNNGPNDCEPGFYCAPADQLSIEDGRGVALCCPIPPTQPSVDACRAGGSELPRDLDPSIEDGGNPTPVDSGNPTPVDSGQTPADSGT